MCNENDTEPPANHCAEGGRRVGVAFTWLSSQAARKHTRVSLLSINRQRRYPIIILGKCLKGNMGFIWHPLLFASFPSSYSMCIKLFSSADVQMLLCMILCISVTLDIVWKMEWGNLHALFHWGYETCLVGRNLCCRRSPYGRWQ